MSCLYNNSAGLITCNIINLDVTIKVLGYLVTKYNPPNCVSPCHLLSQGATTQHVTMVQVGANSL